MKYPVPEKFDYAAGDNTGVCFPTHPEALLAAGPEFLTEAFRCYGTTSNSDRVTRIVKSKLFPGGNSGQKLLLVLEYEGPSSQSLHVNLFVKFSRDFTDGFRDRRRLELMSEIQLALLSRMPRFPVRVPKPYFADFDRKQETGILITEAIAYGENGIEPLHQKCMDHKLSNPLEYYRALTRSLARIAGAHKSGALSPEMEQVFPFLFDDAVAGDPVPPSQQDLLQNIEAYERFAQHCPQLLPSDAIQPDFISRFKDESRLVLEHQLEIKRYLHSDTRFIAFCHWNAHIDNAWFWRGPDGVLECGLMDWGSARQMNVVYALWGCLCGASLETWETRLDEMLDLFACEYHKNGGPILGIQELRRHLTLYIAIVGLTNLMDVPALVLRRLPDAVHAEGLNDATFDNIEIVRSFLHILQVFMHFWSRNDIVKIVNEIDSR